MCFEYTYPRVTEQFRYWFGNQRWGMPKGLGLYGLALCTYIYTYSTYTNVFRLYISSPPATGPTTFNTRHPCLIQQFLKSRTQSSSSSLCCDVNMHQDWPTKALKIDEDIITVCSESYSGIGNFKKIICYLVHNKYMHLTWNTYIINIIYKKYIYE